MVQAGACGTDTDAVVGGTVIAVSGRVTGFVEGLMRYTAATAITTTMMPPIMSQGVRGSSF